MSLRAGESEYDGTVAIAASFAAEPIEPVLSFWLKTLGLPFAVRFAGYGQVFQELLTPESELGSNRSGVNVLLVRLEDLVRSSRSGSVEREALARTTTELSDAIATFVERSKVPLVIGLLPVSQEATAELGFSTQPLVDELAQGLSGLSRVTLLTPAECACYAPSTCFDPIQDELGHVPYTSEYFAALGSALARKIHALRVPARKVLVLDCDNTLWRGVVGEDGVDGIGLTPGSLALQRFAIEQQAQGTLICLCSKNAEADVIDVFERRVEMLLKLEHIVSHRINWQSKVENLTALADELNLGLDSFVFVDDSAIECGQIREALPQVLTLELPAEPEVEGFLRHLWAFDKAAVTEVDKERTRLYRDNVARQRLQRQSTSIGDFIRGLQLEIEIESPRDDEWARCAQLTQRTNQFNFTTLRRSESELREFVAQGGECLAVRVRDRFGDYGLVGLVAFSCRDRELSVDNWLLSCRVLGRGVEHAMLRHVGRVAAERGLSHVVLELRPTSKNLPARIFADSVAKDGAVEREGAIDYRIACDMAVAAEYRPGSLSDGQSAADTGEGVSTAPPPALRLAPFERIARELARAAAVQDAVLAARPRQRREAPPEQDVTETERRLRAVWEELLGIDGIGVDDDFFELGGSSLLAVQLFSRLASEFGVRLPLTTIIEAPTLRALSQRLDANRSGSSTETVLQLGQGSGPVALFLIHDGDGETLLYRGLSRLLPSDVTVYGMSPKRLPGIPLAHGSIEEMAAYQIEQMRRIRPRGPYLLGGLCGGGIIAFEMAAQLERAGDEVSLVALFDAASPTAHRKSGLVSARRMERARELLKDGEASSRSVARALGIVSMAAERGRNVVRYELEQTRRKVSDALRFKVLREVLARGSSWPAWIPSLSFRAIVDHAEKEYTPGRLRRTRVALFRATGADGQPGFRYLYEESCLGWSAHVGGEFLTIDVPGNHSSMLQEPYVADLARELSGLLPSREGQVDSDRYPASESNVPVYRADELLRSA